MVPQTPLQFLNLLLCGILAHLSAKLWECPAKWESFTPDVTLSQSRKNVSPHLELYPALLLHRQGNFWGLCFRKAWEKVIPHPRRL